MRGSPGVPRLIHNSRPLIPSSAENNAAPLTPVRNNGVTNGSLWFGKKSRTSLVPTGVPSVAYSSVPVVGSKASKKTRLPVARDTRGNSIKIWSLGMRERRNLVPEAVPSVTQSSNALGVIAVKTARDPSTAKSAEMKLFSLIPGAKSVAGVVPCAVPSLFQNCPFTLKYKRPWNARMLPKDEPANPGVMSFTRTVPALVPSVRHNSSPKADVLAVKKTTLFKATNLLGAELPKPDQISLTSDVPAAVPSVFQSSRPMLVLLCLLVCG